MFMKHHLYAGTGPGAGSAAVVKADMSLSQVEFKMKKAAIEK